MKRLHFNVEPDGFYGAYWACDGGAGCAVIAMIGDDPEDRLGREMALRARRKRPHHVPCEKGLRPS